MLVKSHLPEYFAEFLGTAIMMIVGIGAVTVMWSDGSVMRELIPNEPLRRLCTGLLFAGGGTAVVLSPLGQRSGGHLNPAVTLAFWVKGQVTGPDAIAYCVAQMLGAVMGVVIVALVGGAAAQSVQLGLTTPGAEYSTGIALGAEFVITFMLMFTILYCVNEPRHAARTPYFAGLLVALLVFVEAPVSGTSLNPARSFAPALLTSVFDGFWLYCVGPVAGAVLAVFVHGWTFGARARAGCAKLFHTERYRCIFTDCSHALFPVGAVVLHEGDIADRAYVVERGELEVRKRNADGSELVLAKLGPGEWVGEMGLLLQLPRSASVVVTRAASLRKVTIDNFAHVIAEHPTETRELLQQLAGRLHEADRRLVL